MKPALSFSFIFIVAYLISILFSWYAAALFFFATSPLMVIYTAFKVLSDQHEVPEKFENQFYQDYPYQRNTAD